jgi:DNA-directed RNA polymerase subunit M/transcription elongation factor TFIIS
MEALRDYARTHIALHVPDRPYAKNIEKAAWLWAVDETKHKGEKPAYENRMLRWRYKQKVLQIMTELTRDPSCVAVTLKVRGDRVRFSYVLQPQLMYRLLTRELTSQDLPGLRPEQLWPDGPHSRALFKNKERDLMLEKSRAKEEDYIGLFKCGKCKSVKTTYYQMQTRSADEPMVRTPSPVTFTPLTFY